MLAKIFDAEGGYIKTVEGDEQTIGFNVPDGGSYLPIERYTPPVVQFGPYPDPDPDQPRDLRPTP